MNTMYPGLPQNLEDDWIEAMVSGEVSPPLSRFLDSHPEARAELESLGDVARGLAQDRDAAHPGDHYFDALADDIMDALPARHPVPLVGQKVAEVADSNRTWAGVWAWLVHRPTLAWGAVMIAALIAVVAWPRTDELEPVVFETDAGVPQPERSDWLAAALPQGLTVAEVHELRQVAADIEMGGIDDPSDTLDDAWGLGLGAAAIVDMGDDELESIEDALEAPL